MSIDKVKPLKIEDTTDGSQLNFTPTETNPNEDYIATKGIAFENTDNYIAEKIGGILGFTIPDMSQKINYSGFDITSVEFYNGPTQTTINRIGKVDITYTGINPTQEELKVYDPSDGTTILRTITLTHTFSGIDITSTNEVTT